MTPSDPAVSALPSPSPGPSGDVALAAALAGVSSAFASLGRVFFCVDSSFHVLHASSHLDRLLGDGAASRAESRPLSDLLGSELFGPGGTLRQLLLAGERREGWRSMLEVPGTPARLVSVTAAPFCPEPGAVCDPRVAFVIVLRPAEEDSRARALPSPASSAGRRRSSASSGSSRTSSTARRPSSSPARAARARRSSRARSTRARRGAAGRSSPSTAARCPASCSRASCSATCAGAFTGAVRDRAGRFEVAAGGTLFLDEIADLPAAPAGEAAARAAGAGVRARGREPPAHERRADRRRDERGPAAGRRSTGASARTCTTACAWCRSRSRRCASGARTSSRSRRSCWRASAAGRAGRCASRPTPCACSSSTRGRATCASSRTRSSTPSPCARARRSCPRTCPAEVTMGPAWSAQGGAAPAEAHSPAPEPAWRPRVPEPELDEARIRAALDACRWRRHEAARSLGVSRTTLWRRMRQLNLA